MRKLLEYLPPVMAETAEMQGIMDGEQPYFDLAWEDLDGLLAELYIGSAEGEGLSRWENILKLPGGGTAEDRRKEILLRMARMLPYTERSLQAYLDRILDGDVIVDVLYDTYAVAIEYGGQNETLFASLYTELRQMIPANMGFTLSAMEELAMALYAGTVLQVTDSLEVI